MDVVVVVLGIAVVGLVVGALGRFALHGKDPMSLGQTVGIGIAGALLGALIGGALWGADDPVYTFSTQVACATAIVYAIRRRRERRAGGTPAR